ncbi:hypothetical protein OC835_004277 [Tilletia horrida]|nr:hypothetical protein OC835_004277 [Tilletia horrida]
MAAGFPNHSSKDQFCAWCKAPQQDWVQHLLADLDYSEARRQHAACPSALYRLPGWSSLDMAPVDAMHAIDLGIARHFWTQTLLDGKLLGSGDLQICEHLLEAATYPAGLSKISPALGRPPGGSPTAADWSILARTSKTTVLDMVNESAIRANKAATQANKAAARAQKAAARSQRNTSTDVRQETCSDSARQATSTTQPPLPLLTEFVKPVELVHILEAALALARASRLAHSHSADDEAISDMEVHLQSFVKIQAKYIHSAWMTYNHHIVQHLPQHVRQHGPARYFWGYPQERAYGIIKQINTNRHRGGQLEHTMQSSIDGRHRVASALADVPTSALTSVIMELIDGDERRRTQANSIGSMELHLHGNPDPAQDLDDDDAMMQPNRSSGHLSPADLAAVCELASKKRLPGDAPIVTMVNQEAGTVASVLLSNVTRAASIRVRNTTIRPRTRRHGANSDPSACIVQLDGRSRVAFLEGGFTHSFVEANTQRRVSALYAVLQVLPVVSWPQDAAMRLLDWALLEYVPARKIAPSRVIVNVDSIVGPAIVLPGEHMLGPADSVVAVALQH